MGKVVVVCIVVLFAVIQSYETALSPSQMKVYEVYKTAYYDPVTNSTLKTEIENSGRLPFTRIGFRSLPCACQDLSCGCCAGINITRIQFDQRACTNFTYDPYDFSIKMDVAMNDRKVFTNKLSAKNPPPFCMPFFSVPAVEMCVRFHDIFMPGNNLHVCVDFETRVVQSPIFVLHFDCATIGADGIVWEKPEGDFEDTADVDSGSPSIAEPEVYDEVNFESADPVVGGNATVSSLVLEEEEHIGQLKL